MTHPDLCPYCRAPISPEQRQRINDTQAPPPPGLVQPLTSAIFIAEAPLLTKRQKIRQAVDHIRRRKGTA